MSRREILDAALRILDEAHHHRLFYCAFGSSAGQFTTTVSGDGPPRPINSCTTNFWPSGVSS
jgi:hypothetical protein